ncbi:MAG TPA: hypothetical protein PKA09_26830, partial [Geminicoccus sp.]|nr:hypothetical protein [Geminicoccus sp.]
MPLDPTLAQSEASRLNALRSTGPVTGAGKAAASRNAVRHGLRGASIEVTPDEHDFLSQTTASLERRWKPVDAIEHNLVQALALMELKLVRLDTIEMQVLAASIEEPDGRRLPSLGTLTRYRNRILKERWEAEHRLRTAIAQRCTNEAEAKALAKGRDDIDRRDTSTFLLDALDQTRAGTPLNREQRRRLAAVQRKAA